MIRKRPFRELTEQTLKGPEPGAHLVSTGVLAKLRACLGASTVLHTGL